MEWDEAERGAVLRLVEYEDSLCRCGCGLPMVEAHKQQAFNVESFRCYASMAIKEGERVDRARAEREAKEAATKLSEHWADGLHYYALVPDPPTK